MSSLLVVENHAPSRAYLAQILQAAGHRVQVAEDVTTAWELFLHATFDAVLLSLAVPPGEALGLVTRIRASASTAHVLAFDHAHLGAVVGLPAAMRLKPDAYVADVSRRELSDRLGDLLERDGVREGSGIGTVLGRTPILQGQLKADALAVTLVSLWGTFRDGVLVLQHGDTERRLYLRYGRPVGYDSTLRSEAFDRWMYDQGRISETLFREALAERAAGHLSAAASLVAVGALESGPTLLQHLREHLSAMAAHAVGLRLGIFRFHEGDEFLSEVQLLDLPTLEHLLTGARNSFAFKVFVQALQPDAEKYPRRSDDFTALLPQLGLSARDLKRALELNGRTRSQDLLATPSGTLQESASLLWFLRLVGALRFEVEPAGAEEVPAGRLRALTAPQLAAVRDGALGVLPATYFRALGLDIACSTPDVEQAYHRVAAKLHPDQFAGYDTTEVRDLLEQIQEKLGGAYRTLADPGKRIAYLDVLLKRAEGSLRRGRPLIPRAEVAARQAERALRDRQVHSAVEHLRRAAELAPDEPDFAAHLALALLYETNTSLEDRLREARKSAKRAVSLDAESARALAALAMVEYESGELTEARRQAVAAIRLDETSVLAKRVHNRINRVVTSPSIAVARPADPSPESVDIDLSDLAT